MASLNYLFCVTFEIRLKMKVQAVVNVFEQFWTDEGNFCLNSLL